MLAALLGSRARAAILARLLLAPDREEHLRELARATGFAPRTVQVEVDRLVAAGIVRERRSGNRRYLSAEKGHPLYGGLCQLLEESYGLKAALEEAIRDEPAIEEAFMFGSASRGERRAGSDVDVLLVGSIGTRQSLALVRPLAKRFGVEITPLVYSPKEFRKRARGRGFVASVLESNPARLK